MSGVQDSPLYFGCRIAPITLDVGQSPYVRYVGQPHICQECRIAPIILYVGQPPLPWVQDSPPPHFSGMQDNPYMSGVQDSSPFDRDVGQPLYVRSVGQPPLFWMQDSPHYLGCRIAPQPPFVRSVGQPPLFWMQDSPPHISCQYSPKSVDVCQHPPYQ